ncbi:MAG: hypothetical protein E7774_01605 [Bradyrhizobium sp.]|nr:MAG: hypothetical protein E7774_01605 [Bradyrhizobium sp.]
MRTYYVDETGFTGEDLLAADQPIFAQATNDFSDDEAHQLIKSTFGGVRSAELKYNRLARDGRHHDKIVELVRALAADPLRAGVWVAHKEYALMTLIVDWWMEPLAHICGLNLYKDGANHGMANMLFCCLEGFWSASFRRKLLSHFQRMFRSRTLERYNECRTFVEKENAQIDESRNEILRYFSLSFTVLGHRHVENVPARVLDIALPGLIQLGHHWNERHSGPWELVHDQSSNIAKQKWMWDVYSSADMAPARFEHPGVVAQFPMNVVRTRFGDSAREEQLQICDILAGACSSFCRLDRSSPGDLLYRERLSEAGIEKLTLGGLWPSTDVTPESLGRKGWDGNVAIEWIAEQMRVRDPPPRS